MAALGRAECNEWCIDDVDIFACVAGCVIAVVMAAILPVLNTMFLWVQTDEAKLSQALLDFSFSLHE